jgi:hypothetical protein
MSRSSTARATSLSFTRPRATSHSSRLRNPPAVAAIRIEGRSHSILQVTVDEAISVHVVRGLVPLLTSCMLAPPCPYTRP